MNNRLLYLLQQQGFRKGLLGGNRRWLTVWSVFAAWKVMGRLFGTRPVVERFELKPGQTVLITDLGAPEPDS